VPGPGCVSGGGNNNPNPTYTVAVLNADAYTLACPGTTTFDGSGSTAADGGALTYSWAIADDATGESMGATEPSSQAVYQLAADSSTPFQLGSSYTVSLTVTDAQGKSDRKTEGGSGQRRGRESKGKQGQGKGNTVTLTVTDAQGKLGRLEQGWERRQE
jgi:hypothetical protein